MEFINGDNLTVYVKVGENYQPIGCLTGNSVNEKTQMLGTTTRDNLGWKTSVPDLQSWSLSFSGLVLIHDETSSVVDFYDLRDLKRNRTLVEFMIQRPSGVQDVLTGYIVSIGESSPVNDMVTFDCDVEGYGSPIIYSPSTQTSFDYNLDQIF